MASHRDKFDIRKHHCGRNGIKYRIRKDGQDFKLEWLSPMLSGSTRSQWGLVGVFQTFEWADQHLKEMESLMGGKQ